MVYISEGFVPGEFETNANIPLYSPAVSPLSSSVKGNYWQLLRFLEKKLLKCSGIALAHPEGTSLSMFQDNFKEISERTAFKSRLGGGTILKRTH